MKKKKARAMKKKNTNKVEDINKKMSFGEILNRKPEAAKILFESGMHCVGCSMAYAETLEQGALMHGLDPDKLIKKINRSKNESRL